MRLGFSEPFYRNSRMVNGNRRGLGRLGLARRAGHLALLRQNLLNVRLCKASQATRNVEKLLPTLERHHLTHLASSLVQRGCDPPQTTNPGRLAVPPALPSLSRLLPGRG